MLDPPDLIMSLMKKRKEQIVAFESLSARKASLANNSGNASFTEHVNASLQKTMAINDKIATAKKIINRNTQT